MAEETLSKEIEKDIRKEVILRLWLRFRWWIIGGFLVATMTTIGGFLMLEYQERKAQERGTRFEEAMFLLLENNQQQAFAKFDEIIANESGAYADFASLNNAFILSSQEKHNDAKIIYEKLSKKNKAASDTGIIASLIWSYQNLDNELSEEIIDVLKTVKDDPLWRYFAWEIEGFLLLRDNDYTAAQKKFETILEDQDIPRYLRGRSMNVLALIRDKLSANE